MLLYLTKKKLSEAPRADVKIGPFRLPVPALAWTGTENAGEICYVVLGRRRIAHEVEHNLAPDFQSNADHHPARHFCGRVGHAIRLSDRHLDPRSLELADELIHRELYAPHDPLVEGAPYA